MARIAIRCLLILFVTTAPAHAQYDAHQFSLAFQYSQSYTPNCWSALRAQFNNNSDQDVDGFVRFPLIKGGPPVEIRQRVYVPARSRVFTPLWGFFPEMPPPPETAANKKNAGLVPDLTMATWERAEGGQLSRCPLLGRPTTARNLQTGDTPSATGSGLLLQATAQIETPAVSDGTILAESLNRQFDYLVYGSQIDPPAMPRHLAGYAPFRVVVLSDADPESLDAAQRQALLQHVQEGAQLIVAAPTLKSRVQESWLAPYLPVTIVGDRKLKSIEPVDGRSIPFGQWVDATEAFDVGANVVLADAYFVHAAWRPFGLGRIIFTSFPVNAIDLQTPVGRQIWKALLSPNYPVLQLQESKLPERQEALLRQMVGLQSPPWKSAAGLAGGYLLLALLVQGVWRGPSRPRAFAVMAGAALVGSLALVAVNLFSRQHQPLMLAGMGLVDFDDHGGHQTQYTALFGQDQQYVSLATTIDQATVRPLHSGVSLRPTIEQRPWQAVEAGAAEQRIDRIWESTSAAPAKWSVAATARFGPDGLTLRVNHSAVSLDGPLLLWGDRALRLPTLPTGRSQSLLSMGELNRQGDFINSSFLTSDSAKLRGEFISALYDGSTADRMRTSIDTPMLLAWLRQEDAPWLLKPSLPVAEMRCESLLRLPVKIEPSEPGSTVRIDPAFTSVALVNDPANPLTSSVNPTGTFTDSGQTAVWLLNFRVPRRLGLLKPTKMRLEIELNAPLFTITLLRGQCVKGVPRLNPDGPVLVEYKGTFGRQSPVEVACSESDIGQDGSVWLALRVDRAQNSSETEALSRWTIQQLGLGFDAQVVSGKQ